MRTLLLFALSAVLMMLAGCARHAYTAPVVIAVKTGPDQSTDVAWFVEDDSRIVRCVNGPDRPVCRRAQVD